MFRRNFTAGIVRTVAVLVVLCSMVPVSAASANISHAYRTTASLPAGSLVSLDTKRTDYVVPATSENGDRLVGVTVRAHDSLLAVDEQDDTTQIATNGTATVLVSTLNGDIKVGDPVGVSPFEGIGARADAGTYSIGLAQTAFSAQSKGATKQTVTDTKGRSSTVAIGAVQVSVGVAVAGDAGQLSTLQKFAKNLTGRTVSMVRITLSLLIIIVTLIAIIILMYSSIYAGIISIGRNPLARYAVLRTLVTVLAMTIGMATIATITVILLLR